MDDRGHKGAGAGRPRQQRHRPPIATPCQGARGRARGEPRPAAGAAARLGPSRRHRGEEPGRRHRGGELRGQRQRKEEQSALDEQAASGGLRREAQEEPQIDGDERANPQPWENGEQQHDPEEGCSSNEQNGDGGDGDKLAKLV
ncbi:hypothetical protein PVAP13_6NG281300 [Panicum virgatum]|uniref:Uncharacterized protein n=1 Tax=Panicum virgatum TaxID=38727 RepID=A0A8T0R2H9_PANVG|nr:hypothetical protein PVAP13_6NG281300 [Panicum virgatum]